MEAESRRLYVQLTQLLEDTDVFDFLCDHTFALLDAEKAGCLRLPQVAPLIENFQAAKTCYPCSAEEVYNIWTVAVDPVSRSMPVGRFRDFIRGLFQDFLALYETVDTGLPHGDAPHEHEDERPEPCAPLQPLQPSVLQPPIVETDDGHQSALTDATDLTQLAKEMCRLSPKIFRKRVGSASAQRSITRERTKAIAFGSSTTPAPKKTVAKSSLKAEAPAADVRPKKAGALFPAFNPDTQSGSAPAADVRPKKAVQPIPAPNPDTQSASASSSAPAESKQQPLAPSVSPCALIAERPHSRPAKSAMAKSKSWSNFADSDFYNGIRSILLSEEAALRFARSILESEFEDFDFGPVETDPQGLLALGFEIDCTWRRVEAKEISPQLPICPGSLADSWFLSALAMIMDTPFLESMWPRSLREFASKGLSCFRFSKHFGQPVYVIVDHALPFTQEKPISAQGVWVALAEKAFAKLHGSYTQLWSGFIDEGVEDITGYPCEKLLIARNFQNLSPNAVFGFARLEKNDSENSGVMRFVHVEGRNIGLKDGLVNTGILRNFIYPVKNVLKKVVLINPWSDGGWLGNTNGTFSLSVEECANVFTHVFVLKSLNAYQRQRFDCVWTQHTSGGTPIPARQPVPSTPLSWQRNPQFRLEVSEPQEVVVCLSQSDPRLTGGRFPFLSSLEEIFILCMRDNGEPVAFEKSRIIRPNGMSSLSRRRQVRLHIPLETGRYVLVPSTWEVGVSKPFALTVYSSKSAKIHPPDESE